MAFQGGVNSTKLDKYLLSYGYNYRDTLKSVHLAVSDLDVLCTIINLWFWDLDAEPH
jgi:hypothetical protein